MEENRKQQKALIWFIIWAALLGLGSVYKVYLDISHIVRFGVSMEYVTYSNHFFRFVYTYSPILFEVSILLSHIYAIKESNKTIMSISLIIFVFQTVVFLFTVL